MKHLLLCVIAAGCGGGSNAEGDGGTGGDGGGSGTPTNVGSVSIQSYTAMNIPGTPLAGGSASASFSTVGCTNATQGPCEIATCPTAIPASAGTITVTGAAQPITLTPGADKTYAMFMASAALYAGGETLMVSAAGGDVPAFTGSFMAPSKVTITSPAKPASASPYFLVTRSAGLTVSWTGGSGSVQVSLFGGAGDSTMLQCRFAAAGGTGTIPAAALAMLPAGQGGFAMAAIADKQLTAGDYAIDLSGYFNAVWPDDAIVSGPTMVN